MRWVLPLGDLQFAGSPVRSTSLYLSCLFLGVTLGVLGVALSVGEGRQVVVGWLPCLFADVFGLDCRHFIVDID